MSLEGKVALVTGSSRGIGRATALELAREGANIVVNYFRKRSAAQDTVKAIQGLGVKAISVRADMGKAEAIEALFAEARDAFGGIDILVCNAASGVFRNAMELDKRSWDWTMNINALSTLRCSQHAVPMMESRGGGRIVAVSSIGSLRTLPLYCGIGASKGAIETLARYLAVELAPRKIIVNCVAPGAVGTDEWKLYPEEGRNEILPQVPKRTPIGRMLTAEDVAKVVAFLCRFDLDAIVGQTITVDGGFSVYL